MKRINSIQLLIVAISIIILFFFLYGCRKVEYCEENNVGMIVFTNNTDEDVLVYIDDHCCPLKIS